MAKTPLLLLGGGGHCASVVDVIESIPDYEVAGIIETDGSVETSFLGYPVLGTDSDLPQWIEQFPNCVITVGQIKSSAIRKKLFERVKSLGGKLPVIQSPLARVASSAKIAEGSIIMHFALVNHYAEVGSNVIINNRALVEHGAIVGNDTHVSTGAIVNGDCCLGSDSFLGSGAVMVQGKKTANQCLIGAGSVVTRNLEVAGTYIGNPASLKESL